MVDDSPVRYQSDEEDSGRWSGFPFRAGDIVISTRSKSGTTWMQMICALLVFQTPELPVPLIELSPWLDWLGVPRDEAVARLAAQEHRRVIKTHTPLDGLPLDARATFIVVGRHPLDMAVSLYHQGNNLDRVRISELTGRPPSRDHATARPPLQDWLVAWIDHDADPRQELDSLPGVLWHLSDAWARRHEPNIVLVHFDDLCADLDGSMRNIATRLDLSVPDDRWTTLVDAAGFEQMRARAEVLAPDVGGVMKDRTRFFRRGSSGAGREELSVADLAHYEAHTKAMVPADLWMWLHRDPPLVGRTDE
jgi:hypothetical protein